MNTIPKATPAKQFFACVHFSHKAARITKQYHEKRRKLIFSRFCKVLLLLILSFSNIHADDLKVVPQQAEVIEPESEKKELPNGKFEMSISIDNEFTSSIAKDISDLQDKLKNSAKETVNDSMKAIGKEIKSSITDIVKEAAGAIPKSEVVVIAPTPAPTPEPRFITNDIILARSIARRQNKKLLIYFGNTLCPVCRDITSALDKQHIVKPRENYVVLILDMMSDEDSKDKALVVQVHEFRKAKPELFRKTSHPVMIIESPNAEILFAKKYDINLFVKKILIEMQETIEQYRYRG
jgi:hypothetical protein